MDRRMHSDLDVTMTLTSKEAPKLVTSIHCTQQPVGDKGCCMQIQHWATGKLLITCLNNLAWPLTYA